MRLTRDEIILLTGIFAALLLGAIGKHCRAEERLHPRAPVPRAATPAPPLERIPK